MYAKDNLTIVDQRELLRVKSKSLAEEARIIRKEEQRTHGIMRNRLQEHRRGIVRLEARATGLAYGFIRGHSWEQMEPKSINPPNWKRVREMIKKYGPRDFVEPECMSKK